MDAARLTVDVCDEQMLLARIRVGDAAGEEVPRGIEAVDRQRSFGTLIAHSGNLMQAA